MKDKREGPLVPVEGTGTKEGPFVTARAINQD
jgi:hypothetical protein